MPPKLAVGDIVLLRSDSSRVNVIHELLSKARRYRAGRFETPNKIQVYVTGAENDHWLAVMIDHDTGLPLVCPDSRCKDRTGCPICTTGAWADQWQPLNAAEIQLYVTEKMLDPKYLKTKKDKRCRQ